MTDSIRDAVPRAAKKQDDLEDEDEGKAGASEIPGPNGILCVPKPLTTLLEYLDWVYAWSPKLRALVRNLAADAFVRGRRSLVWVNYPFEQMLVNALLTVQGFNSQMLISDMDPKRRADLLDRFNKQTGDATSRTSVEVLICSHLASGVGLNLHHDCASVHLLTNPQTQSARDQAIGRIYRIGQRRPVQVIEYQQYHTFDDIQARRLVA